MAHTMAFFNISESSFSIVVIEDSFMTLYRIDSKSGLSSQLVLQRHRLLYWVNATLRLQKFIKVPKKDNNGSDKKENSALAKQLMLEAAQRYGFISDTLSLASGS